MRRSLLLLILLPCFFGSMIAIAVASSAVSSAASSEDPDKEEFILSEHTYDDALAAIEQRRVRTAILEPAAGRLLLEVRAPAGTPKKSGGGAAEQDGADASAGATTTKGATTTGNEAATGTAGGRHASVAMTGKAARMGEEREPGKEAVDASGADGTESTSSESTSSEGASSPGPSTRRGTGTPLRWERWQVGYPEVDTRHLIGRLRASDVRFEVREHVEHGGGMSAFSLISIFLMCLIVGYAIIHARRQRRAQRAGAFGDLEEKKVDDARKQRVMFREVAGCDEAVEEVQEFSEFLRAPGRFQRLGARMPRGVVLHGPPGTGKTMLAKALAFESDAEYFAASGSEFVERYVGVGALRVRQLFAQARKAENGAVIFIDEIDALGRTRDGEKNFEHDATLNQLLVEMDGFGANDRIVIVAATNRLDVLDPALLRPGRFSRHVHVGLPSAEGRERILGVHARGKPLGASVDLRAIAEQTFGCSGAMLSEILNEAAILAARSGAATIEVEHVDEGYLRVIAGPEKRNQTHAVGEREIIACHEAGHVVCAEMMPGHEKAQRATIRARGLAAGMAIYGQRDKSLESGDDVFAQLVVLLGGRAAEQVTQGRVSSGAANDLTRATDLARRAVEQWGLSAAGQTVAHVHNAQETRNRYDHEVDQLVTDAYTHAVELLREQEVALRAVADLLLLEEDVNRLQLLSAMASLPTSPSTPSARLVVPISPPVVVAPPPRPTPAPDPARRRTGRWARVGGTIGGYANAMNEHRRSRSRRRTPEDAVLHQRGTGDA